jgi:hypothetical protein
VQEQERIAAMEMTPPEKLNDNLYDMLVQVIMYIDSALEYDMALYRPQPPRCASCGSTEHLTAGYAGGNEVVYCSKHAREEEQR